MIIDPNLKTENRWALKFAGNSKFSESLAPVECVCFISIRALAICNLQFAFVSPPFEASIGFAGFFIRRWFLEFPSTLE